MKEEIKQYLLKELVTKKYSVIGGVIGLTIAILFIVIGFWKTILLTVLVGGGFFLGQELDQKGFIDFKLFKAIIEKIRSFG